MEHKQASWILFSALIVAVVLIAAMLIGTSKVNADMTRFCFDELERTANRLSVQLKGTVEADRNLLGAIAQAMANENELSQENVVSILGNYHPASSFFTSFEFLQDGVLIRQDGRTVSVPDDSDYYQALTEDNYVSPKEENPFEPGSFEVRYGEPVIENGRLLGILFGVTELDKLNELFNTEIFNYHAYVYIIDCDNGDFLLDTWHNSLGNIWSFGERQTFGERTFEDFLADVHSNSTGSLRFTSQTIGKTLYMYYQSAQVNNWMVMLTVTEDAALANARTISKTLYWVLAVCILVLLSFVVFVLFYYKSEYRKAKKLALEDKATGLQNRNAFENLEKETKDRVFPVLTCAYIDINGLHEINNLHGHDFGDRIIETLSEALKASFPRQSLYRLGGDEFIVLSETADPEEVGRKLEIANRKTMTEGSGICYAVVRERNTKGIFAITKNADSCMLDKKREMMERHNKETEKQKEAMENQNKENS